MRDRSLSLMLFLTCGSQVPWATPLFCTVACGGTSHTRTWYRPCQGLQMCRVPLKPRFLLRRLTVRQMMRVLPVGCRERKAAISVGSSRHRPELETRGSLTLGSARRLRAPEGRGSHLMACDGTSDEHQCLTGSLRLLGRVTGHRRWRRTHYKGRQHALLAVLEHRIQVLEQPRAAHGGSALQRAACSQPITTG